MLEPSEVVRMPVYFFRPRVLLSLALLVALAGCSATRAEQPLDIDNLTTQMQRAVPTANVTLIPTSNGPLILTGKVTHAEDVDVLLGMVNSIPGITIINALCLAEVKQVQLDVLLVSINRDTPLARCGDGLLVALFGLSHASAGPSRAVLNTPQRLLDYLRVLREWDLADLLLQPTLKTRSGEPAQFLGRCERGLPIPSGFGSVGIQFEELGTQLTFLPIVLGNGNIHLEVETEISELNAASGVDMEGATVPGRETTRLQTVSELKPGQSLVIRRPHRSAPYVIGAPKTSILGSLPFLGKHFMREPRGTSEVDLLLVITPHMIEQLR
jgi:pilus assembly protein CpaC